MVASGGGDGIIPEEFDDVGDKTKVDLRKFYFLEILRLIISVSY
jgi:hypothetical protein